MSLVLFPLITPADPAGPRDPDFTYTEVDGVTYVCGYGRMCSWCGRTPYTGTRCPNHCPTGSQTDDDLAVVAVLTTDLAQMSDHITPAALRKLGRLMFGNNTPWRAGLIRQLIREAAEGGAEDGGSGATT